MKTYDLTNTPFLNSVVALFPIKNINTVVPKLTNALVKEFKTIDVEIRDLVLTPCEKGGRFGVRCEGRDQENNPLIITILPMVEN